MVMEARKLFGDHFGKYIKSGPNCQCANLSGFWVSMDQKSHCISAESAGFQLSPWQYLPGSQLQSIQNHAGTRRGG